MSPVDRVGVGKCASNVGVEGNAALGDLFSAHYDTLRRSAGACDSGGDNADVGMDLAFIGCRFDTGMNDD